MWKRRAKYDPMKAAAEGKRKQALKQQNQERQSKNVERFECFFCFYAFYKIHIQNIKSFDYAAFNKTFCLTIFTRELTKIFSISAT